ncbi:MAG TPA: cupin domain-containing protein [Candidatus Nitrosocosmicus sp.]|nr:cupin domain-containing protein [Candidatus Nitrosocosmicus sp.]
MRDKATILEMGQGTLLSARGSAMFFKATRASTDGAFSLMERTLPPGGRKPPPHVHTNCEEAFYVLDGEIEFSVGETTTVGQRDTFVLVPGGVAHTFGNAGTTPARLLVIHAPAMDAYFEELQALWSGDIPPTQDAEVELMRRHGMEPAGS